MTEPKFDRLAKIVASDASRRGVIRGLVGAALSGLSVALGGGDRVAAQVEATKKKCGKGQHSCPHGECCKKGHACCNQKRPEPGRRVCCPKGWKCCGGFNCCPPDSTCDGPTCVQ